jgi:hypothetical protein
MKCLTSNISSKPLQKEKYKTLKWQGSRIREDNIFCFQNKGYTYGLPKRISYQALEQPMSGSKAEQLSPCHKSEMPNLLAKHWSLSYNMNKEMDE